MMMSSLPPSPDTALPSPPSVSQAHTSNTPSEVHPVFLAQAKTLISGGELLPGGVTMLAKRLQQSAETQKPLVVKLGLDPTRPDLHLGHAVVLEKFRAFQDLGHQGVLLIGDATAMVGDPTGKNATRPPLTEAEVTANAETYLAQAGKIVDVEKATIVRNSTWLSPLKLAELIQLMGKITVAQMLTRDDFSKRYDEGKPISLHEFLYPLLQAYDSVHLRADIELGGSDQRFNNLLGRELQSVLTPEQTPQMVLLLPLLEGTDGIVKMSKSYPEHCIQLTATPQDMFGKLMSIPDALIPRYESLLSTLPEAQVTLHTSWFQEGGVCPINPRDLKMGLALWVVARYHGAEQAELAQAGFIQQFSQKQLPTDMPCIEISSQEEAPLLIDWLVAQHLQPSKAEAKRLMVGGGLKERFEALTPDTLKLDDPTLKLTGQAGTERILQLGKRQFVRCRFV
ncbi:MAG: tyrosine--tRNA ligase [Vampirovibrionales bacterium]